jgi:hypothetical protein
MGKRRNICKVLIGKPEGKGLLGRPWRGWEDNIILNLKELEWKGVDWIYLGKDREKWRDLLDTVINLRVPYISANFLNT